MTTTKPIFLCSRVIVVVTLFVLFMCDYAFSTPMLYKKNTEDKYEADLIPVSSTVIPLTALEVSYGLGGKPSEEYKEAYLRKLRKKVQEHHAATDLDDENPDTLITIKKKHHDANKAKVKADANN